jgi:uncharacterized membrane protein
MFESIKQFIVPMIVRRILTLIFGALITLGFTPEVATGFTGGEQTIAVVAGLIGIILTFVASLFSKKKAVDMLPPTQ